MENLKKEIIDFIIYNPAADITIHCVNGKSYGLICLNLFNFALNIPQHIIYGEYDSDNTGCINIDNTPKNIKLAVDRLFDIVGNNEIKEILKNE